MRIFTPDGELLFAGHPALGTAHVVRALVGTGDELALEFKAGVVPVSAQGDIWTFAAPHKGMPKARVCGLSDQVVASLLGLAESDLLASPIWLDTGAEHLLLALNSTAAVCQARPDSACLDGLAAKQPGPQDSLSIRFRR